MAVLIDGDFPFKASCGGIRQHGNPSGSWASSSVDPEFAQEPADAFSKCPRRQVRLITRKKPGVYF